MKINIYKKVASVTSYSSFVVYIMVIGDVNRVCSLVATDFQRRKKSQTSRKAKQQRNLAQSNGD